ncbi:MAG: hypothetical protein NVS2B3_13710 [Vulcanimicrobiaceae bacterium]
MTTSTWTVPPKLAYALFVAGDTRLGEAARPALSAVLESLEKGPPPAVELRSWIVEHGRMGTIPLESMRQQLPGTELLSLGSDPSEDKRLASATNAMLVAADDAAAIDPRAPWGLLVLATTMASASGGVVYDSGTFRFVPPWILESPLDGFMLGSIKNHIAIVSSVDAAGLQTTTTLGLNKYGLFELELAGIAADAGNVGILLAGLAQALVDARPLAVGPWEVPAFVDVTRFHVANALARELDPASETRGRVRFTVQFKGADDVYWRVAGPDGPLDTATVAKALRTLGIEPDDPEAAPEPEAAPG